MTCGVLVKLVKHCSKILKLKLRCPEVRSPSPHAQVYSTAGTCVDPITALDGLVCVCVGGAWDCSCQVRTSHTVSPHEGSQPEVVLD